MNARVTVGGARRCVTAVAGSVAIGSAVVVFGTSCASGPADSGRNGRDDARPAIVGAPDVAPAIVGPAIVGSAGVGSAGGTDPSSSSVVVSSRSSSHTRTSSTGAEASSTVAVDAGTFVIRAIDDRLVVTEQHLSDGWDLTVVDTSAHRLELRLTSSAGPVDATTTVVALATANGISIDVASATSSTGG